MELQTEVERNYDAFQRVVRDLMPNHRDQFALMRDRAVVGFFDRPGDAYRAGLERFADERFSIQEVTDEPIDLGFYSHVGH
jgi:hypothetical protein